jgi:non-heme chloroperoxidase
MIDSSDQREPSARPGPESRWTHRATVRLHWLDSGDEYDERTPLLFVPGFGEEAFDHTALIEAIAPRRVIVPDLRGRGHSDSPEAGYSLEDHVGDLEAIIRGANVDQIHIACYSRGTAYAVKWATGNRRRVKSLTIGDYPAEHITPPKGAADFLAGRERFGRPLTDRVEAWVIRAVFEACRPETYYAALAELGVPLLLVYGGRQSSLVDRACLARYQTSLPELAIECFERSGHDLWRPDALRFAKCIAEFIQDAD